MTRDDAVTLDDLVARDHDVWRRFAPLGLLLVGAGLCVVTDASARRARGAAGSTWALEGAGGLVVLNAGLSVFGEAVKRRALYDVAGRPGPQPR